MNLIDSRVSGIGIEGVVGVVVDEEEVDERVEGNRGRSRVNLKGGRERKDEEAKWGESREERAHLSAVA